MKRCYTLSKSGYRININTFKRTLYPRYYTLVHSPFIPFIDSSSHLNVSKASCLPSYVRFILWIKRNIFKITC